MTIAIVQYRPKTDDLWCIADSRISSGSAVASDSGPKIFPISVICYKSSRNQKSPQWKEKKRYSFGFAFAGSTLTALGTYSLASACTQNLAVNSNEKDPGPPSLEDIAQLFRQIAEFYIADTSARLVGNQTSLEKYFFLAFIFGYCPKLQTYKIFGICPNITSGSLKVLIADGNIAPWGYHPIGSGQEEFIKIEQELKSANEPCSVTHVLKEMLKREVPPDVGGHFQVGVANRKGFTLKPILNLAGGKMHAKTTFLGWPVEDIGILNGYRIGYETFSPDV